MVGGICFTTNADPPQIRRDSGNVNIIFLKERSGVLRSSYRIRFILQCKRY